jgi:hypothetical protein
MIDGILRNRKDRNRRQRGEKRKHIENAALSEVGADHTGQRGDKQIAETVEYGVAAELSGNTARPEQAQCDRGDCRREHGA